MSLMRWGANSLCIGHWLSRCIVAVRGDAGRNSMRGIAGGLVKAQTMLRKRTANPC